MSRKCYKQYAMYKGDEFVDVGTAKELAKKHNLAIQTFYWYATCTRYNSKEHKRGYVVFPLDDELKGDYE